MVQIKSRTFPSTTLVAEKPSSYDVLNKRFNLVRYIIPSEPFYAANNNYKRLYVQLKAQLQVPYRPFSHDPDYATVVYALYPQNVPVTPVVLDFVSSDDPLVCDEQFDFNRIGLFNVIKLLQAKYFDTYPYFASRGEYYIHAKQTGDGWHVCLEIEISGANQNITRTKQELPIQEFYVSSHARYFIRMDDLPENLQKRVEPYYAKRVLDSQVIFEELKYGEIDTDNQDIYRQYSRRENPARLAFHDHRKLQHGRGYILDHFLKKFTRFLIENGIQTRLKTHQWNLYSSVVKGNLNQLPAVLLYDNRLSRNSPRISDYQMLLRVRHPEIDFQIIESLENAARQPVLILQDAAKEDFAEDGVLCGQNDPYLEIYRQFPHTPKQSINVNQNSDKDDKKTRFKDRPADYLTYPLVSLGDGGKDSEYAMRVQVCLYQLYLKDVVVNKRPVSQSLPLTGILASLAECLYVSNQTYRNVPYAVLMRVDNDELRFLDLRTPSAKRTRDELVESFGLNWYDIEDILFDKYHRKDVPPEKRKLPPHNLILMPNMAIELEEVPEAVLYKYEEIERRQDARSKSRSINEFYLSLSYDSLKAKHMLTLNEMKARGLLDGAPSQSDLEKESFKFYQQLLDYDEWLDQLAADRPHIKYNELTKSPLREEIGRILSLPTTNGKYNMRRLHDYYQNLKLLTGDKKDDVQISRGIWYADGNYYRVADVYGFKDVQERDHRIRRFDVLVGDQRQLDILPFLEATAVKFVRFKQYTVNPYFFYLIDKYIEDVLHPR